MMTNGYSEGYEFRLAPRTILVNGVEVPAGESEAPQKRRTFFAVDLASDSYFTTLSWSGDNYDFRLLYRGLVYLDKESAIARAKAMLITQEVK